VGLLLASTPSRAETNAAAPWRLGVNQSTVTNAPAPPAANPNAVADADLFFTKYKDGLKLVERNDAQGAAIALDLLAKSLSTSPWMEIAIFKHAQLIESTNDRVAEENYLLLRQRLINAPYFQGNAERARVFAVALQGSVDTGITRLRIRRVRVALGRYFAKHMEYPESLPKLAILNYTDMENIHGANNQMLRYVPKNPQMTPFISYKGYDLEPAIPEPFTATTPRLESTSQVSDTPPKYVALIKLPGRVEPARVEENQTIQGFFVAAVAPGGAIVSTPTRVLVLPVP
jgi:hypothetical protein